jgi:hypothetical protein
MGRFAPFYIKKSRVRFVKIGLLQLQRLFIRWTGRLLLIRLVVLQYASAFLLNTLVALRQMYLRHHFLNTPIVFK